MILTIKGHGRHPVRSVQHASEVYCQLRDSPFPKGASEFPSGRLPGFYVSYNGKVWRGKPQDWKPGDVPVWNPYG